MESIQIENVGPNARISLPYLVDGGVVVLRGDNDMGKTEALRAIKRLAGGDEKLTRREGQTSRGSIEGFGVTIHVGASSRQAGECDVMSLEGRLDIGDLIDPPVKSPVAADRTRIKAMLSIAGIKADPSLFHTLAGGEDYFRAYVSPETLKLDDLVDMAAGVKRDLEKAARAQEQHAERAEGTAKANEESVAGLDLTGPCDAKALDDSYRKAVNEEAKTRQTRLAAVRARNDAEAAQQQIDRIQASYSGRSVQAAEALVAGAQQTWAAAQGAVVAAQVALRKAEADEQTAHTALRHAEEILTASRDHDMALASCRDVIEQATRMDDPGQPALEAAQQAVQEARAAVERGVLIRKGKIDMAAAESARGVAVAARKEADRLREAAWGTDAVLSEAVEHADIKVKDGRLVTVKGGREVFFADRSKGYRARVAIDVALDRVRTSGHNGQALIVLGQEVWEGLDAQARLAVQEHAQARRVTVYTAEANRRLDDPPEVRAEVYQEVKAQY